MPVPLARAGHHQVAGSDAPDLLTLGLDLSLAAHDVQDLAAVVRVPVGASSGLKADHQDPDRLGVLVDQFLRHRAGEIVTAASRFGGGVVVIGDLHGHSLADFTLAGDRPYHQVVDTYPAGGPVRPGPDTGGPLRIPLAITAVALLAAYAVETLLATHARYFSWDPGVERSVQALPWGGIGGLFVAFDRFEGLYQVGFAVLLILFILVVNRGATLLVVAGALSASVYYLTQASVHRPRPDPHLVHVTRHTSDYSYPSGHVVFFLWVAVLVTVALRHSSVPRAVRVMISAVLVGAFALATIGRMYLGEHWPSDVLAGLLLGSGWSLGILSVRRLTASSLGGQGGE